ncbi:MAG TPA: arylsulfotransferase family protein [Desulfobacteraceae bacterium]|nr:arylsulfotransferase family protein [Desulfobacteraceae bacterium]HPJ68629.1 arylsulfotransferase family protein [Desulfobacteraceae bacterium]HPQ27536.1 arylsulfotransferase family protein [Desulfobacteraceae bacterium]
MKYMRPISCFFLVAVIFFSWGFFAGEYETFPGSTVKQIRDEFVAFVKGGEVNKKSIVEKLANDMGIRPERLLVRPEEKRKGEYQNLEIGGLKKRRSLPQIYMDKGKAFPSGYLIVWGAFDFETHLHGAILIDENGTVIHKWVPDEEAFVSEVKEYNKKLPKGKEVEYKPPQGRFPHGLVIYQDGSLIFNDGDPGNGMQKIDFCSNVLWIKLGKFNHVISKQESESSIWAMDKDDMLHKIDSATGESLQIIQVEEIMESNPDVDILSIRRDYIKGEWFHERWHFNDIEPLPVQYKGAFQGFNPGDLLLSMRSLNAVMVIDPDSKKIKWWRVGVCSRQHDPDWQQDGCITVYDNQMRDKNGVGQAPDSLRFSQIVRINVNNYQSEVIYEGKRDNFYSHIRGNHQILPNGSILITSSNQGRVLIVNNIGKTVFELLNKYGSNESLLISEAIWLPHDFFNFDISEKDCLKAASNKTEWHAGQNSSLHYTASRMEIKHDIQKLKPLPFETELSFNDNPFLVFDGWSKPEQKFRWSEGNSASLHFRLPREISRNKIFVKLCIHTLGRQKIQVYCNDKFVRDFDVQAGSSKIMSFNLPASTVKPSDVNTLRFVLPGARSPDSPDPRLLAMALHGIEFNLEQN